jgi:hypothetical protein
MKGSEIITISKKIRNGALTAVFVLSAAFSASAQEYVSLTNPAKSGKAPGAKVKLLSTNGKTRTYLLVLATGDEVTSGIAEFAQKYQVKNAHYTAFGDATSAKFGWFDKDRKMFKLANISEPMLPGTWVIKLQRSAIQWSSIANWMICSVPSLSTVKERRAPFSIK